MMLITSPIICAAHPGTCAHPHAGCPVTQRTYQPAQWGTGGIASVAWWTHVGDGVYVHEHTALPVVDGALWLGRVATRQGTPAGEVPVGVLHCLATWLASLGLEDAPCES